MIAEKSQSRRQKKSNCVRLCVCLKRVEEEKVDIWSDDNNVWIPFAPFLDGLVNFVGISSSFIHSSVLLMCAGVDFGQWKSHNLCAKRKD